MKKISSVIVICFLSSCSLIPQNRVNTISFRGKAEISATPDIATFTITSRVEDKDLVVAQQKMTNQSNQALDLLAKKGINKNDITTENYNTSPRYYYQPAVCEKEICRAGKRILTGFETSHTISFKVRNIAQAGEILSDLAQIEIAEIDGPNFVIENREKLKSEAQAQAITKAKFEATKTAENLGVVLRKIVNFSEDNLNSSPFQYRAVAADAFQLNQPSPQLESGQQKIISSVTITYEIE